MKPTKPEYANISDPYPIDVQSQQIKRDCITRYQLSENGTTLTYAQVLALWQSERAFRDRFTGILAADPFAAYRFETPALTRANMDQSFEFVLLDAPDFCDRAPDRAAFSSYFTQLDEDGGIVTFSNLGSDATMVVPSGHHADDAYGHLAAFVRNAPAAQTDAFWRVLANAVLAHTGDTPIWLSTAGGGVAWLHARIDAHPKYYRYAPYRKID